MRRGFQWQSEACCERLPVKISLAERAIDVRLRTGQAPDTEEHSALSDALSALENIASQQDQEKLQDDGKEDIA
jgi:hypothetical protein